jgi:hypothetical protein
MRKVLLIAVAFSMLAGSVPGIAGDLAVPPQSQIRGLPFDVFIRIQQGMSEGEVLLRAGKPDSESVESMRNFVVKTYYYFPTPSDPWITTIRIEGGRVANLERVKKF